TCSDLLASFPPKNIRLTKLVDEIFERPKLETDDNFMQNTQTKKFWHELILRCVPSCFTL
ncbi:hypothetical protein M422DRAFT_35669, partial [Sphaerobolus stellatus SS14]